MSTNWQALAVAWLAASWFTVGYLPAGSITRRCAHILTERPSQMCMYDSADNTDEAPRLVECREHGLQGPAYVCQHLNLEYAIGFVEGFDPDEPETELYQAWCAACDEVLIAEGTWNDAAEAFARPRLVCRACYNEMRMLNRSPQG